MPPSLLVSGTLPSQTCLIYIPPHRYLWRIPNRFSGKIILVWQLTNYCMWLDNHIIIARNSQPYLQGLFQVHLDFFTMLWAVKFFDEHYLLEEHQCEVQLRTGRCMIITCTSMVQLLTACRPSWIYSVLTCEGVWWVPYNLSRQRISLMTMGTSTIHVLTSACSLEGLDLDRRVYCRGSLITCAQSDSMYLLIIKVVVLFSQ